MNSLQWILSAILIWLICAILSAAVARQKKANVFDWFMYGLFFGIFGLIAALIVKSPYTCQFCKEAVRFDATVCPHCQREIISHAEREAQALKHSMSIVPPKVSLRRKLILAGLLMGVVIIVVIVNLVRK